MDHKDGWLIAYAVPVASPTHPAAFANEANTVKCLPNGACNSKRILRFKVPQLRPMLLVLQGNAHKWVNADPARVSPLLTFIF
ncbi:hypothetical protein BaRGS_00030547 [Batillaria attramentaria]|uniref:Uncharacterized protein n=1 Tax=Batillaria attramentaria TaxID=370345 RepID=A0ABD0JTN8_9CAEN